MADLKSELSKNLQRLILGLMMTPAEFDAKMMKKAMEVHRIICDGTMEPNENFIWVIEKGCFII